MSGRKRAERWTSLLELPYQIDKDSVGYIKLRSRIMYDIPGTVASNSSVTRSLTRNCKCDLRRSCDDLRISISLKGLMSEV